jgi:hypothetical protein
MTGGSRQISEKMVVSYNNPTNKVKISISCTNNNIQRGLGFSGINRRTALSYQSPLTIDRLICCFTSRSRIFHLYGDVTITGEGLQNLGLCSALKAFKKRGIFIVPHLLRHGASIFPVSFICLLRHTRGCGEPILTRIFATHKGMIDWLFTVLRPAQEYFTLYGDVHKGMEGPILGNPDITLFSAFISIWDIRMRPEKQRPVSQQVWHDNSPVCSKALIAEQ